MIPLARPKPTDTIARIIDVAKGSVNGPEFAVVLSYDAATQRATVQPVAKMVFFSEDGNGFGTEKQPPIPNVPVMWPTTGDNAITFPISQGDKVLLFICSRSLDEYKQTGNNEITQQDYRRFSMQDAIAIPMNVLPLDAQAYAVGAMVLQGMDIRLGSSAATDYVALATPTDANFNLLLGLLTTLSGAPSWVAAAAAINLWLTTSGFPVSTGATQVKAV